MDHPTVFRISEAFGPIDGIIGFPFFSRYKMTVDYQKKELTLVPNKYVPGDYMESLTARLMSAQQTNTPKIVAPMGLWGIVVDKDAADDAAGVTVKDILPGGPAEAAGFKTGDRLLTIDGRWTDNVSDTFAAVGTLKPGKPIVAVIERDAKQIKLSVTPIKGI